MTKKIVDLGTPHLVAELSYAPPVDPPASGTTWDESVDYPGVTLTIAITTEYYLHPSLRSKMMLLGKELYNEWGDLYTPYACGAACRRRSSLTFRAATMEAAEAAALAALAEARQTIGAIVSSRVARLATRAATIAMAHARHGEITDAD
jgi:hypothetical protein